MATLSSEELNELQQTLENWTDLAVTVVLVEKSDALFKRIIAVHCYNRVPNLTALLDEFCSQGIGHTDKLLALRNALSEFDEGNFCVKVDHYDWSENHDTRRLLLKHNESNTLALEEKKRLKIGLIHEFMSVLCRDKHWLVIDIMNHLKFGIPIYWLSINGERDPRHPRIEEDPHQIKNIRNKIVHVREEHSFKDPEERDEFLEVYEAFVRFCIIEKNWLCLPNQEQRERTVEEYLKPQEDFWNIRQIIETYQGMMAELEKLYPELEGDHMDKFRRLKAERDNYKRRYDRLFDHIESRKEVLQNLIKDATTEIEDGRETASEGVVKKILEIEKIVERLLIVPEIGAEPDDLSSDEEDDEDEIDPEERNT